MNGVPVISRLSGYFNVQMTLPYAHLADLDIEAAAKLGGAAMARAIAGKNLHFMSPSLRNFEISINDRPERCLEETCFGNQRNMFMRVPPLHEQVLVLPQRVSHARIDRRQSCHRVWNFRHPLFKSSPRVVSQAIEQLQKIVSLIGRPVAFFTLPCLQSDLGGEGQ